MFPEVGKDLNTNQNCKQTTAPTWAVSPVLVILKDKPTNEEFKCRWVMIKCTTTERNCRFSWRDLTKYLPAFRWHSLIWYCSSFSLGMSFQVARNTCRSEDNNKTNKQVHQHTVKHKRTVDNSLIIAATCLIWSEVKFNYVYFEVPLSAISGSSFERHLWWWHKVMSDHLTHFSILNKEYI